MGKTYRKHYWDFDEKLIADGVKYGHDSKKICAWCRSNRLNKRNIELAKFSGGSVRGNAEKVVLQKVYGL